MKSITILVADDDAEDRMLLKEAFIESRLSNDLVFVENGEDVMDYLLHSGSFTDKAMYPRPGLILLDLNMPKKDGREVLRDIKSHPQFKDIPVVVLTTSKAEEDIVRSYNLGVNSFISKPVEFKDLVNVIKDLGHYWFDIVVLPSRDDK